MCILLHGLLRLDRANPCGIGVQIISHERRHSSRHASRHSSLTSYPCKWKSQATITLAWTPPAPNGSPVTTYQLERDEGGALATQSGPPAAGTTYMLAYAGPSTTCTVNGLRSGVHYRFRVRAQNGVRGSVAGVGTLVGRGTHWLAWCSASMAKWDVLNWLFSCTAACVTNVAGSRFVDLCIHAHILQLRAVPCAPAAISACH